MLTKPTLRTLLEGRFVNDKITKLSLLPSPSVFIGMDAAVERAAKAISNNEKITIIGDYDVDGVSSCAIMQLFFDFLKYPIDVVIPNRFTDGYGLSPNIAQNISNTLVITVDNGIMAVKAAEVLSENGCDLIIIDHHTIGQELPKSMAIVHPVLSEPKLDITDICAASVVWYFVAGLKGRLGVQYDMKELLPLVAIATIADVMPLLCINRTLVKAGLGQLNISKLPFATALKKLIKDEFSSETIAFQVAPRLNSAGRMSTATVAFDFLSAKSVDIAIKKLEELSSLNERRKEMEAKTYQLAIEQLRHRESDKVAVVYGEDWHEGVLGIVASRIAQNFKKPAIVLSVQGDSAKGSARSVGNISIFELLSSASHLLDAFGGHKAAAGLTLKSDQLCTFSEHIKKRASLLDDADFASREDFIGEMCLAEVSLELCDILDEFEPYGQSNERPKFLMKDMTVDKYAIVGKEQNVLKLTFRGTDSARVDGVCFRSSSSLGFNSSVNVGDKIDVVCQVIKNSWNGNTKAEIVISDFLS